MPQEALNSLDITIALIGQFTAHGGALHHNIVQFVLAGSTWALLLAFALYRRKKKHIAPHEDLLAWGFAFGVLRETFMLSMALLESFGVLSNQTLHIFFPPLEHVLLGFAMILVCGAYLRYLLEDKALSGTYLRIGIAAVSLCYLVTFWWWGQNIIADPSLKFGQTWCDWLFRINSSAFIAIALVILFAHTRGWTRNAVCLALFLFFLHEFLKIPDMALGEAYEYQITPFRHGFYLIGIPILGYVYLREQIELEETIEKSQQQSEQLYRTLVESVNLGISLIDRNHTILMANRAQHDLFKKPYGYFTGRKCFEEFEKRDAVCAYCPGTFALRTGQPKETDVEQNREDGSVFKSRIKAFPVFGANGEVESFIEVVEDITERVRIEEELQQARNIESIGVLAGGVAHDFNNILASIFGFTDLARLKQEKDGNVDKELEQIRRASHRARDLVQQILTISRRQQQEKKPVQVSLIIKEALKLLRSSIPSTIVMEEQIISEASVLADPTQIHQLIMNLCTNAYQAMEMRGGTLSVSLEELHIGSSESLFSDHVLAPGRYVRLKISDTGPGIDDTIRDRIFEPYFTTKEVGRGTGLGLAVVLGIVKSHQGRISVDSEPGEGTTFTVYLPVSATRLDGEAVTREAEFRAHGNERIMVVDDEKDIRDMLTSYLVNFGYAVDVYRNGREAWEAYEKNPGRWDLIFTDQTMPDMTGTDLVQRVREMRPDIPVVLCTGYSRPLNSEILEELGINAFLNKPATMSELLMAVRTTLDGFPPGSGLEG